MLDISCTSSCYNHLFSEILKTLGYYCDVPKFSDRQVWANNADPVQTTPGEGAV